MSSSCQRLLAEIFSASAAAADPASDAGPYPLLSILTQSIITRAAAYFKMFFPQAPLPRGTAKPPERLGALTF